MDVPAPAPVLLAENARSPRTPRTVKSSGADRHHQLRVVAVEATSLRGGGDVAYAEPGGGGLAGFAEPARDPGPEAPGSIDRRGAEQELATAAEAFVGMPQAEIERVVIEATVRACGGSLPKAARVLGVSPSTLYRKRAGWADRSGDR